MYRSQELSPKEQGIRASKNKEIEVNLQKLLNDSPLGKVKKSAEQNLEKTNNNLKDLNNSLKKKEQEISSKENELVSINEQVLNYKPRGKKITDLEKNIEEVKNTYKNKEDNGLNYDDRVTYNL
jgi:chromosome segregation ATPase